MREKRSGLRRLLVIGFVIAALTVCAIEASDSDLVLESKTYELIAYGEVAREQAGDVTRVVKSKRFGFLPGAETLILVRDASGRTVTRITASVRPGSIQTAEFEQGSPPPVPVASEGSL